MLLSQVLLSKVLLKVWIDPPEPFADSDGRQLALGAHTPRRSLTNAQSSRNLRYCQ